MQGKSLLISRPHFAHLKKTWGTPKISQWSSAGVVLPLRGYLEICRGWMSGTISPNPKSQQRFPFSNVPLDLPSRKWKTRLSRVGLEPSSVFYLSFTHTSNVPGVQPPHGQGETVTSIWNFTKDCSLFWEIAPPAAAMPSWCFSLHVTHACHHDSPSGCKHLTTSSCHLLRSELNIYLLKSTLFY